MLFWGDGLRGFRGRHGSLRWLRGQFVDVGQHRGALEELVELGLGKIWGMDTARLAPTTDGEGGPLRRMPATTVGANANANDGERVSQAAEIR